MPLAPWPVFALAALGVAFAVAAPPLPGKRFAWLALVPLFVPRLSLPAEGEVRAVVLDVGHGLAVLVETRHHRLLFDAGPTFPSGFDTGADIVLPALAAGGRRDLDVLIVSHADNDHAGGIAAVVAAFPEAVLLAGPDVAATGGDTCNSRQEWEWDGVRFRMLHPEAEFAARGNESSCVLKVETEGGALLLTGDIERRGEAALADAPLRAEVVVVPHHGSATSSTPAFVAATEASYAVVSAGWANRWGFPRPDVRRRWRDSGAAVLVTGESGAVHVAIGRNGVAVRAERDGRHRYWQKTKFPW
jgi:competence protein ComEC